ncbi:MAG: malto-oligosyltrehalose trehalohydrolase [Clostridia bacterium]|nr:malto-oligosyltrehalose trehalohydrolase [Clostridia bacterium]
MSPNLNPGATYLGNGCCRFCVWAPRAESVAVRILTPERQEVPLIQGERGYFYGDIKGVQPGSLYYYLLDGEKERPDPASRYQPQGVHGPSQVVDTAAFKWSDQCWHGPAQQELVFYELHVGTFTAEGTLAAIIPHLESLRQLGITALELMPLAQFPGQRNWGYDGVYPYAVQNSYGGPKELQQLVDSCHRLGLAVFLDVVYNHLGPEGNYFGDFGFYFSDRYHTPWGMALNFDGPGSDEVRRFFINNALYWLREFHIDGLRLDAVHAIIDNSAIPFLEELSQAVHREGEKLKRRVYIFAESDLNNPRLIQPQAVGGYGIDGQWSDDFHHALHALLTGEQDGYYQDFGCLEHLARVFREGYVYSGQYSPYRQRRHGRRPQLTKACQFVVYAQNHDQVGNRVRGQRLSNLVGFSELKLAAAIVLLSPFIPLLFMGEEYGETAPFQYFTSHTDPELAEAVQEGRKEEFAAFDWDVKVPNPQAKNTFLRSRLQHQLLQQEKHRRLRRYYQQLLRLRRELPALANLSLDNLEVIPYQQEQVLLVHRWSNGNEVCLLFSFNSENVTLTLPLKAGSWCKHLDSAEEKWLGKGTAVPALLTATGKVQLTIAARTCLLFERIKEA